MDTKNQLDKDAGSLGQIRILRIIPGPNRARSTQRFTSDAGDNFEETHQSDEVNGNSHLENCWQPAKPFSRFAPNPPDGTALIKSPPTGTPQGRVAKMPKP